MPYTDSNGKTRFTLKEKQDYHNRMAKKGATKEDKKTAFIVNVSDFSLKQMIFDETRITDGLKWQLSKLKEFDFALKKQKV